jgi:hypothetical protein
MSAQPLEQAPGSYVLERKPTLTLVPDLVDDVNVGLQQHFGDSRRVTGYGTFLEKDYIGAASHKMQIGGRMIVAVCFENRLENGSPVEVLEINDAKNPLPLELTAKLGAIANKNWEQGVGTRRDF